MNLSGKRVKLAADKGEAFAEWHRLAAAPGGGTEPGPEREPAAPEPVTSPGATITVNSLAALYLSAQSAWAEQHARRSAASLLGLVCSGFGEKRVAAVTADDFTSLARCRGWAASTAMAVKRRWAAMCTGRSSSG